MSEYEDLMAEVDAAPYEEQRETLLNGLIRRFPAYETYFRVLDRLARLDGYEWASGAHLARTPRIEWQEGSLPETEEGFKV